MASRTEIVAILSSRVSFNRMLVPYFFGALILASISLYLNNSLIPKTNKARIKFENTYVFSPYRNQYTHIHRQIAPETFVYMERFDNIENTGNKFSLEKFKNGKLIFKLLSESASWDTVTGKWKIKDYYIRKIDGIGEKLKSGKQMDTLLNLFPADLGRSLNNVETMNYTELNKFIREEKERGSGNIEFYEIEKYRRFAFPFSTFILTLIGVSLASRKVRGGIGAHIGLGLGISFSYILFMQISNTFAAGGIIAPYIAVWIPNFIYSVLAVFLFIKAPK